jgi:hypothetical protein
MKEQLESELIEYAQYMVEKLFAIPITDKDYVVLPECFSVSMGDLIFNILQRTRLSLTTLVTALFYLKRLKNLHPGCKGSKTACHRLVMSAFILAAKNNYDDTFDNKAWASVSLDLFSLKEINQMEKEFLYFLDYRLHVCRRDYVEFLRELETDMREHFYKQRKKNNKKMKTNQEPVMFSSVSPPIKDLSFLQTNLTTVMPFTPSNPEIHSLPERLVRQRSSLIAEPMFLPISQFFNSPTTTSVPDFKDSLEDLSTPVFDLYSFNHA